MLSLAIGGLTYSKTFPLNLLYGPCTSVSVVRLYTTLLTPYSDQKSKTKRFFQDHLSRSFRPTALLSQSSRRRRIIYRVDICHDLKPARMLSDCLTGCRNIAARPLFISLVRPHSVVQSSDPPFARCRQSFISPEECRYHVLAGGDRRSSKFSPSLHINYPRPVVGPSDPADYVCKRKTNNLYG